MKCYRLCFFQPLNDFCSVSLVPRNQLLSVAAACKVLIEFSLLRLENPDEACAVSQVREAKSMGDFNIVGLLSTEHFWSVSRRYDIYQCIFCQPLWLNSVIYFFCMFLYKFWLLNNFKLSFSGHVFLFSVWDDIIYCINPRVKLSNPVYFFSETPDSSNKRTLHWLQQTRSHRNHYFHCYDEICQVASNRQNPFRW